MHVPPVQRRSEQTFVPILFGRVRVTEAMLPLLLKVEGHHISRVVLMRSRHGSLVHALDTNDPTRRPTRTISARTIAAR
ncbi:hypothetical protein F4677DRAFT_431488 [Hypoxylon crocopeplum]|nr:hypothetical protein F4677DRAFT_431488 [Hypoxylon crocopeplum]